MSKNIFFAKTAFYRCTTTEKIDDNLVSVEGNLETFKCDSAARKLKSESNAYWDWETENLMDPDKMQVDHKRYI